MEKWKKILEISLFVPKITIIWCTVSQIWCETDRVFVILDNFCPFTPLTTWKIKILKKMKNSWRYNHFAHLCTINYNHIMDGSWDIEHEGLNVLSFWTIVCSFTHLTTNNPKNQNFDKVKKSWRFYHFTQMCTINYNYMMYGS